MWLYFAKCLQVQPLWGRCKYQQNYACAFKWLSIFECICLKFRLSAPPDSKSKHGVFWGLGRVLWKISHPEPNTIFAILGKEREALGLSVSGRNLTGRWYGMRSSILARIPGFRQRIIPEPRVPSRGSQAWGTRLSQIDKYTTEDESK
jgi:hypothetical protein